MATLTSLIGSQVLTKDSKILTSSFAGEGKVIGLYFSAHWCPPCRSFTPQLAQWFTKFKQTEKGKHLEIVFVSSDRDEASFKEYFDDMPWYALPFEDKDTKAKLGRVFKVAGIPKLAFIDGNTGEMITGDGRSAIMEDPEGDNFPWRPKALEDVLAGLALKGSETVDLPSALQGKIRGYYFSAHWCPPCRAFTPRFCETYKKIQAAGKEFEVVFVSSDRSEDAFKEYHATMPWLAIPYNDDRAKKLSKYFEVEGIPTLVILDENNRIITSDGRGRVSADPDGEEFPWYPKPLNVLTEDSVGVVNEQPCLVYMSGSDSPDDAAKAKELLLDVATAYAEKQKASPNTVPELAVLYEGPESEDLIETVRSFANLPNRNPLLVLLNIPEQKKYIFPEGEITKDSIKQLMEDFEQGKVTYEPFK